MLRACGLDFARNQDERLPLIELLQNSSYHLNIKMGPYEALYEKKINPYYIGCKMERQCLPDQFLYTRPHKK